MSASQPRQRSRRVHSRNVGSSGVVVRNARDPAAPGGDRRQDLVDDSKPTTPTLEQFLSGLRTAWKEGDVRPTARLHSKATRLRRRPDPFATPDGQLREWFAAEPWRTSRELLERLQSECPGVYPDKLLRTLQRRV